MTVNEGRRNSHDNQLLSTYQISPNRASPANGASPCHVIRLLNGEKNDVDVYSRLKDLTLVSYELAHEGQFTRPLYIYSNSREMALSMN